MTNQQAFLKAVQLSQDKLAEIHVTLTEIIELARFIANDSSIE